MPEFAVPVLRAVNEVADVLAVVTQPDKPVGRNMKLSMSPVKREAMRLGIPVLQYNRISRDGFDELNSLGADIIVTCAYGQILRSNILDMTPYGVYNVHGSILPKYRGAAPIARAIMAGEGRVGITILKSDVGIDDGKVLFSRAIDISSDEDCGQVTGRLSVLGAECIVDALAMLESGKYTLIEQDDSKSTYAHMIKDEDRAMDFTKSSRDIVNHVRALSPSPLATFSYQGQTFKVSKVSIVDSDMQSRFDLDMKAKSGVIVCATSKAGLIVRCGDGFIKIDQMQAPNGKMMSSPAYLCGKKMNVGESLE